MTFPIGEEKTFVLKREDVAQLLVDGALQRAGFDIAIKVDVEIVHQPDGSTVLKVRRSP